MIVSCNLFNFLKHQKVHEFLGELATGVVLYALDFELPPLTLDAVIGPDQVAQQSQSKIWGIFEAKGGKGKLGKNTSYGDQMSGPWITHWIEQLIKKNRNSEYGNALEKSFYGGKVMLAAVTRLNIFNKKGKKLGMDFQVAVQKYEADEFGANMKPWGSGW